MPLLWFAVACSEAEDIPAPEPQPEPPVEVGRTVLVYMVANNNLGNGSYNPGYFDIDDIEEMKLAAGKGALGSNRLILFHSKKGSVEIKEVTSSGAKVLKTYPTTFSAVEAENMRTVIADVKSLAPARNYGIVLWSHANGWLQTGIKEPKSAKRAFGDDKGQSMNVTTLAKVLEGEDFDFVYFDCCFMGGVEVAYQLRDATPTVVASVSELPSPGMPYDLTLPFLMADAANPMGAAQTTFNHYNALSGDARTCTMSVIDTERLPALAAAVKQVYATFPNVSDKSAIQQYVSRYDTSFYGCYYDLQNYLHDICGETPEGMLAYAQVSEAINDCITYRNATPWLWEDDDLCKVKVDWHCGLSTFIFMSEDEAVKYGYNQLNWFEDVASAILK